MKDLSTDEIRSLDQDIAESTHDIMNHYKCSLGEIVDNYSLEHEISILSGMDFLRRNGFNPAGQHTAWMKQRLSEGWKYGEIKDSTNKTHPCLVDYNDLPDNQKSKDYLFAGCVKTLTKIYYKI